MDCDYSVMYEDLVPIPHDRGIMLYTSEGSNPALDLFYIRPPSASTYYDENPIKWVMHGVFGVYSTNSYFSFLFSFDVLTRDGHFCLLGLFLSLDYVYIITGF